MRAREWVVAVLRARGIEVHQWAEKEVGLINVPARYCAIIEDLQAGLEALERGEPLPTLRSVGPSSRGDRR